MNTYQDCEPLPIQRSDFEMLAEYRDLCCISLYIPYSPSHSISLEEIRNRISEQFRSASNNAHFQGLMIDLVEEFLMSIQKLTDSWKKSQNFESLIIFISQDNTRYFLIPRIIPFTTYVNDHFYLKLIAQLFNGKHNDFWFQQILQKKSVITMFSDQCEVEKSICTDVSQIVLSSSKGLVKTLFLQKGNDVHGEFDSTNNYVLSDFEKKETTSLSNIAAIHTILNRGNIYELEKKYMPIQNKPMNAIIKKKS